jgi:hypothetical protein
LGFSYRKKLSVIFAPQSADFPYQLEIAKLHPEWLREKNTKTQRALSAKRIQISLGLSAIPLMSAGPRLLLDANGAAE